MANGHGGYRRPRHPAPVSGPGALSKRTDGDPTQPIRVPTGLPYGENQQLHASEAIAPLPAVPDAPTPASAGMAATANSGATGPGYTGVPFGAPTTRPDEPITAGVNIGAGPGSEILPVQHQPQFQTSGPMTQMLTRLSASDPSGQLSNMLAFARAKGQ